jgi:carbon storage regulator
MLVLARKVGEQIHIGDNIRIRVTDIQGSRVRIAIDAPQEFVVRRLDADGNPVAKGDTSP